MFRAKKAIQALQEEVRHARRKADKGRDQGERERAELRVLVQTLERELHEARERWAEKNEEASQQKAEGAAARMRLRDSSGRLEQADTELVALRLRAETLEKQGQEQAELWKASEERLMGARRALQEAGEKLQVSELALEQARARARAKEGEATEAIERLRALESTSGRLQRERDEATSARLLLEGKLLQREREVEALGSANRELEAEVESRMRRLSSKVQGIAAIGAKNERLRGDMVQELELHKARASEEHQRRVTLDAKFRRAKDRFKAELWKKSEELMELQALMAKLQGRQRQSLQRVGRDLRKIRRAQEKKEGPQRGKAAPAVPPAVPPVPGGWTEAGGGRGGGGVGSGGSGAVSFVAGGGEAPTASTLPLPLEE